MQPKPFTAEEYEQWLRDNFQGWGSELLADTNGEVSAEDAVYDVADAVKYTEGYSRAYAYLKSVGCRDIKGSIADFLYELAYEE